MTRSPAADLLDGRLGLLVPGELAEVDVVGEALEVAALVLDAEPHQHLAEGARWVLLDVPLFPQPDPQPAGRGLQVAVEAARDELRERRCFFLHGEGSIRDRQSACSGSRSDQTAP